MTQSPGSWFKMAEADDKYQAALDKEKAQASKWPGQKTTSSNAQSTAAIRAKNSDNRRKPWEPSTSSRLSTTETPPSDEPLCEGVFRGSRPVTNLICHQYEFSSLPILVRETYIVMCTIDVTMSRKLPFAIYQHYCFTLLNAYIIDYQRTTNQHPDL